MVETNLEYYSTDSHCGVRWKNPPKTTPEEMMEESTLLNAVTLLLAGGMIVAFVIGCFWLAAIVEFILK